MEAFAWDQSFTTGLAMVDQQHHHLVDLINQLGESMITGEANGTDSLQAVFNDVADYARYHFAEEERLMRESGVDPRHCSQHRQQHAEFVEQLSTMWGSHLSISDPVETLHGFLRAWLAFHILDEDQNMARQIASIGAGKTAAEAYDISYAPRNGSTAVLLSALHNLYGVLSAQNRDLAAAKASLEARVATRTQELAEANQALTNANRQLELLSNTDGLLKIANRRYFDFTLDQEWHRALREGKTLALLMIDVDFFKRYNDTHGHQAGDACLQSVAQAALSALKRPSDLLARYGGEELAVILPGTDLSGAVEVAQWIQKALAELHIPHLASSVAPEVTISIGAAAMVADRQAAASQLMAAADHGLYAAKHGGRNRICTG
jgi:diguanylate cyclase (GGDEF)-like protein/hemerythrin-like metal-binding protein